MSITKATLPLVQVVKHHTAISHEEVEQILLPQLQNIQSIDDYVKILQVFYGFFYPLEEKINHHISANLLPDISSRRTASFILKDLAFLGIHHSPAIAKEIPAITNSAQAFGALYVLEGSTLGGKMIAKMLVKNKVAPMPTEALHFFQGYGEHTGSMWTRFVRVLNQQTETDIIIRSAQETFIYLKKWMQQEFYGKSTNQF